jgi:Choline/Carnitine o-acyltransferase
MEKDAANASNFDNIDASLFALCLDDYASGLDLDKSHRNLFHGQKARNRWFDKAMQFIVENNGRAGVNGEVGFLPGYGEREMNDVFWGSPRFFFFLVS